MAWGQEKGTDVKISALPVSMRFFDFVPCSLPLKTLILLAFLCFLIRRRGKAFLFFYSSKSGAAAFGEGLHCAACTRRSRRFTILFFSVPAGTEFCEAAVKWKSVADFYPQGVRGIRKAAKLPTAAQDCRARRQIMLNLFWRDRK